MSAKIGKPSDLRLLDEIVDALIRRHHISFEELEDNLGWNGRVADLALEKAKMLAPETLGRIIYAVPNAGLYDWHCGTWLGKYESGPYLLQQIAATAMICRMRYQLGVGHGTSLYFPPGDSVAVA